MVRHKTFLLWLLYVAVMIGLWTSAVYAGLPQIIWAHDALYISVVLLGLYAAAEVSAGLAAIRVSRLAANAADRGYWLRGGHLSSTYEILEERSMLGKWLAVRIEKIGIVATFLGVVIAFWPFLSTGSDIEAMKGHLGEFFAGLAVAFIPATVSIALATALDFSARIIRSGLTDIREAMQS